MSLLYIDGMGHYATAQIAAKYTTLVEGGVTDATFTIEPTGRFHNCLVKTCDGSGSSVGNQRGYVTVSPLMNQSGPWTHTSSGVLGFALKVNSLPLILPQGTFNKHTLVEVRDGDSPILALRLEPNGTLGAYVHTIGATGISSEGFGLAQSSIEGLLSDTWTYIEFSWEVSLARFSNGDTDTPGYMVVHINGVEVLNYVGATGPSSFGAVQWDRPFWNTIWLLNTAGSSTVTALNPLVLSLGDLYLADLEGGAEEVNDFLGDVVIDQIVPNGVGAYSNWSPNTAANWDAVEETPPDDDVTYVATQTSGTRDSYTLEDVAAATTILGYQTLVYARKETEGGAMISPTLRIGGTDYDATAQGVSSPSRYQYLVQPYDTNPATALQITPVEINAAEGGILKVV